MRYGLVLLIFVMTWIPSFANAADVLLGTVVSVRRDTGEVIIRVAGRADAKPPRVVRMFVKPDRLPPYVRPDMLIRVWGEYAGGTFQVRKIMRGRGGGRGNDPTGVHRRLRKGRGGGMSGGGRRRR